MHDDLYFVIGNGTKRGEKSGAENFYEDELKSSRMAESEVETRDGKRRGFLSRGIKQDLYAANGERFREKVFIERILVRHTIVIVGIWCRTRVISAYTMIDIFLFR